MAKLVLGGDNRSITPAFITVQEKEVIKEVVKEVVVGDTRFGLSLNNLLGYVDENGTYKVDNVTFVFDGTGIKNLGYRLYFPENLLLTEVNLKDLLKLDYQAYSESSFINCSNITSINLDSLTRICYGSATYMFSNTSITSIKMNSLSSIFESGSAQFMFSCCPLLKTVELNSLNVIEGDYAAAYMFLECDIENLLMPNLHRITGEAACMYMFANNYNLQTFTFESLQSATGQNCLAGMFSNCTSLQSVYFPQLIEISSHVSNYIFSECNNLTEIHFREDMQSMIEECDGYPFKFGASNATIYFDL